MLVNLHISRSCLAPHLSLLPVVRTVPQPAEDVVEHVPGVHGIRVQEYRIFLHVTVTSRLYIDTGI